MGNMILGVVGFVLLMIGAINMTSHNIRTDFTRYIIKFFAHVSKLHHRLIRCSLFHSCRCNSLSYQFNQFSPSLFSLSEKTSALFDTWLIPTRVEWIVVEGNFYVALYHTSSFLLLSLQTLCCRSQTLFSKVSSIVYLSNSKWYAVNVPSRFP